MRVLLVKPADSFLENEFTFQQLSINYLQSYLEKKGIESDLLILSSSKKVYIRDGKEVQFEDRMYEDYDWVGISATSPQAPEAYRLAKQLKPLPCKTILGGPHAKYYLDAVLALPDNESFDRISIGDGWSNLENIINESSDVLALGKQVDLKDVPPPTRQADLMKHYRFEIGGIPSYTAITSLGCPFSCNFCEASEDPVKRFPNSTINSDLENIARVNKELGRTKYGVMFFDDVGLVSPRQATELATMVWGNKFATWRAFTHPELLIRHRMDLLSSFKLTGGERIGMGLETGSEKSMKLINKSKNGSVEQNYEATRIANEMGVAVDAFTMIYPWEDEKDLKDTRKLVEFVVGNKVNGTDSQSRPLKNHIDSTIMSPFQGTPFYRMMKEGEIEGVELNGIDPSELYYKGQDGQSGWAYKKSRLPRETYELEQEYRNSLRPEYR